MNPGHPLPPPTRFVQGARFPAAVRVAVDVRASRERLWTLLTDLKGYAEWNPFTPRVDGAIQEDAPVHLEVHLLRARPLVQTEYVHSIVEGWRVCWGMELGHRALLTANRIQTLEPLEDGRTRYVSEDRLSGWLTPVVMALYGKKMQEGFQAMADALKARAEQPP